MSEMALQILSLGAGVQSSALEELAKKKALGLNLTASIMADTKDEPRAVYAWVEKLKARQNGHPIITVCEGCLMSDALVIKRSAKSGGLYLKGLIPAYLKNEDGTKGLLGRRCTPDYKIKPIVRECRKLVGNGAFKIWRRNHKTALAAVRDADAAKDIRPQWAVDELRGDPLVRMVIGISADEADRMKPSKELWIRPEWPLVDNDITREDCAAIVKKIVGEDAPRSACKKCPFHSDEEWAKQKRDTPDEFAETVAFERAMQKAANEQEVLRGVPYLHDALEPIDQVCFKDEANGYTQLNLFRNECHGLCGV